MLQLLMDNGVISDVPHHSLILLQMATMKIFHVLLISLFSQAELHSVRYHSHHHHHKASSIPVNQHCRKSGDSTVCQALEFILPVHSSSDIVHVFEATLPDSGHTCCGTYNEVSVQCVAQIH